MRIGLDLDGTIVVYDALFHREAVRRLGLPERSPMHKEAVRDWVRSMPDGEGRWVELQSLIYGPLMREAPPAAGVLGFVARCREHGLELTVISHRTVHAVGEPSIDLHAAARQWLERHTPDMRVFLETTRAAKLDRIRDESCALFVDDLPEVFAEPAFPTDAERWLYAPTRPDLQVPDVHPFADWDTVLLRALELRELADGR